MLHREETRKSLRRFGVFWNRYLLAAQLLEVSGQSLSPIVWKKQNFIIFSCISSCSTEGICGSRCPDSIRIHMVMLVQNAHSILVSKKNRERKKEKKNSQWNISTKEWWGHAVDLCVCPGTQTTVIGLWLADCCPQLHQGYLESC